MKAVVLVLVALLAVAAAKLEKVDTQTSMAAEMVKSVLGNFQSDREWHAFSNYVVQETNKRVARAKMAGKLNNKLGGCLAKELSLRITPGDLDETSVWVPGNGAHEGFFAAYKDRYTAWDGTFTVPLSVSITAAFFVGISGSVGINIERYTDHLLIRPCLEASLTLGLSVGVGASLNFGLYFGDSEFGAESNLQLGGTISAGIGLSMNVLLRLGPGETKEQAQAAESTAATAQATPKLAVTAQTTTEQITAQDNTLKTKAKAYLKAILDWAKKSTITGIVFGIEVGFKVEGPTFVADGVAKSVGEGVISGLFAKVVDKLKGFCECKKKCKKILDKIPELPDYTTVNKPANTATAKTC